MEIKLTLYKPDGKAVIRQLLAEADDGSKYIPIPFSVLNDTTLDPNTIIVVNKDGRDICWMRLNEVVPKSIGRRCRRSCGHPRVEWMWRYVS